MKQITAVFSSNQVNRYGMMFPVRVLESALNQSWNKPVPSSIGHDIHRTAGWAQARALHIQPGLARIFGTISHAENADDLAVVEGVVQGSLSRRISELDKHKVSELRARLKEHLSSDAVLMSPNCVAYHDAGLATRVLPTLFSKRDKDGLISMSLLQPVAPGVFVEDGVLVFAHQFFRRSLSRLNNLNDPFLRHLNSVAGNPKLDGRVALDDSLIGHRDTLLGAIELQYWWGPYFSDELGTIAAGVTQHGNDDFERIFNGISRTEFWWYEQRGQKTFECEEVRDLDVPCLGVSPASFGCRFIHSILDPKTNRPFHSDGAVRIYDETQMVGRVDMNIMRFGRKSAYTKLWRIDGDLGVAEWKAIISDYFRDNHLVGEYFGAKEQDEKPLLPRTVKIDKDASILDFAPCTMSREDGVRISISYHEIASALKACRCIECTETFQVNGDPRDYFEGCTIDIIKLLKRRGETVDVPTTAAIIAFEDMVFNLPLIIHCEADAVQAARTTMDVLNEYCATLSTRGDDRMIAFHIGVRFSDRDVFFSFAGHVDDMTRWLNATESGIPLRCEEIGQWAEMACLSLTKMFPHARDIPPLENMIKTTGLLTIDRKFLEPGEYKLVPTKEGVPVVGFRDCPSIQRVLPLVKEKHLTVTNALRLIATECQRCHKPYETCDCIKALDDGVCQEIKDAELLGFFWTDRSAWMGSHDRQVSLPKKIL
jgi:hypothetical protein